jgi:DNA-binding transcriptional MerR regulator
MNQRSYRSIGDVLTLLREEFPDVTISKIRFLESQGLVNPQRSPSGYRKFYDEDVERLRYVLLQQRENFLPLKVIRDRLNDGQPIATADEQIDGATSNGSGSVSVAAPPASPQSSSPQRETSVADVLAALQEAPVIAKPAPKASEQIPAAEAKVAEPEILPTDALTADELAEQTGLTATQIADLESYGILRSTKIAGLACFRPEEVSIAKAAHAFCAKGIEARHLRAFRTSVDREMDLYEQMTAPLLRQRSPEARQRAEAHADELAAAGRSLRQAMLSAEVDRLLGR